MTFLPGKRYITRGGTTAELLERRDTRCMKIDSTGKPTGGTHILLVCLSTEGERFICLEDGNYLPFKEHGLDLMREVGIP